MPIVKEPKRKYWINTNDFTRRVCLSLVNFEPDMALSLTYDLTECSWLTYYVFLYFKINLKAKKGDTFKWMKQFQSSSKTK